MVGVIPMRASRPFHRLWGGRQQYVPYSVSSLDRKSHDRTAAVAGCAMVAPARALLLVTSSLEIALAWHVVWHSPPMPPPVLPARAWYCPRLSNMVWALWPNGAEVEVAPRPFLPGGELGLHVGPNVNILRIWGASLVDWDAQRGEGTVRLSSARNARNSWRLVLSDPRGTASNLGATMSSTACNTNQAPALWCANSSAHSFANGPAGLPVVALTLNGLELDSTRGGTHAMSDGDGAFDADGGPSAAIGDACALQRARTTRPAEPTYTRRMRVCVCVRG
jgi:hypothetical protein